MRNFFRKLRIVTNFSYRTKRILSRKINRTAAKSKLIETALGKYSLCYQSYIKNMNNFFLCSIYDKIYSGLKVPFMIAFVWLFPFGIVSLPLFQIWGKYAYHDETHSCTILKKSEDEISFKSVIYVFTVFIPCAIIILCYSAIYRKVHENRKNLERSVRVGMYLY